MRIGKFLHKSLVAVFVIPFVISASLFGFGIDSYLNLNFPVFGISAFLLSSIYSIHLIRKTGRKEEYKINKEDISEGFEDPVSIEKIEIADIESYTDKIGGFFTVPDNVNFYLSDGEKQAWFDASGRQLAILKEKIREREEDYDLGTKISKIYFDENEINLTYPNIKGTEEETQQFIDELFIEVFRKFDYDRDEIEESIEGLNASLKKEYSTDKGEDIDISHTGWMGSVSEETVEEIKELYEELEQK